ncbi:MAG: leucine-rich repeat domain-containing protein [Turicibacter sp.]|nr:leucine-rich repeat domain-containing protein [Turicibacter sp.]
MKKNDIVMSVKYLSWIMMLLLFVSCSSDDIESEEPAYVQVLLKNTGWRWSDKWLDIYDDWYMEGYDSYELHFIDDKTGYLLNHWYRNDGDRDSGTDFDHFYYEVKSDGTIHLDFITHDAVDWNVNQIKVVDNQHLSCVGPDCDLLLEKIPVNTEPISEYTFKFENASLFLNSAGTMVIKGSGKLAVDGVTEENCQQIYKWQNHYVKSVEFDGDITHIGDYLFYKSNVETIKNWDSVESIGKGAFFQSDINCPLPNKLKYIGPIAFSESGLTDLSDISCRGCYIGYFAFNNCKSLQSVNENFIGSATHIGNFAFNDCTKLVLGDLHFTSQIDSIDNHAFTGVKSIKSVTFDEGVKYIGYFAFNLLETTIQDELRLPNSIKSIHTGTFCNFRVNKIYLGNAVEYIDDNPFIHMNGKMIGDLYVPMDNPVSFKENYFSPFLIQYYNNNYQYFKLDHLWTLHVPKGSKKLYQQAYVWKGFGTIVDDL